MGYSIGFVGAGHMARALAGAFIRAGHVQPDQVWAGDPSPDAREAFASIAKGIRVAADNRQVAQATEILIVAVKPQHVRLALEPLRSTITENHLVMSICAGVTLEQLATMLPEATRLVRVMPNRACLVARSATAYCAATTATAEDRQLAAELLGSVGVALPVEERLMDAVTGLAGSGPAFVYVMIEALSDGGVLMGMPRNIADTLAVQTVFGAAAMASETGRHPALLKEEVTSPGGTTMAGLEALEGGAVRAALMAAVRRATERCAELRDASS